MNITNINYELKDFNYISDIHADFYADTYPFFNSILKEWIKNSQKSDIVIVAGDLANRNKVSYNVLKALSENWKYVFYVDGNHDLYDPVFFADRKPNRIDGLLKLTEDIKNLYYMSKDKIFVFNNGIKMAGCNLWYDMDRPEVFSYVMKNMNDSKYVGMKYITTESAEDKKFYNNVIDNVDIFVSHVPVVDEFSKDLGFTDKSYCRTVEIKENKKYIYGHMHEGKGMELKEMNSVFLTRPVGYSPSKDFEIGFFEIST